MSTALAERPVDDATGELTPISTAIAEYRPVARDLAAKLSRLKDIAYTDLPTLAGMQAAIDDRRYLIDLRVGLGKLCEQLNKKDRADTKVRCEQRETEAEKLTAQIRALEGPIDDQIKAEEARKEKVRQEKLAAEKRRTDTHEAAIAKIRGWLALAQGKTSAQIAKGLGVVNAMVIDRAACEEFADKYEAARSETATALQALLDATLKAERLAAEQEQQRRENERLQAELDAARRAAAVAAPAPAPAPQQDAQGGSPVDAPAVPGDAPVESASNEPVAAVSPSGDEGTAAPAEQRAADPAPEAPADKKLRIADKLGRMFGHHDERSHYFFTVEQLVALIEHVAGVTKV